MTREKRIGLVLAMCVLVAGGCYGEREGEVEVTLAAGEKIVVENVGFKTPESVLYDPVADVYLVSNINGSSLEADGNGFISRLSPDGTVEELMWIDGTAEDVTLNAPKGMTISGKTLYVTDITVVRMFDRESGAPKGEIAIEGSTFLNDLTTGPDGTVYVTDSGLKGGEGGFVPSGTDAVYRITENGTAEMLAGGDELSRPNGIVVDAAGVWVVPFGSASLYRVEGGQKVDVANLPTGGLDGLIMLTDGDLLVSSWEGQAVYRGPAAGPFDIAIAEVQAPADIGFDTKRNHLLIPLLQSDVVEIHPVK